MPKYIANAYLVQKGKVIQTGQEVELTEDQGKRLGDKVTIIESDNAGKEEYTETDLKNLSADEQKSIVEELGGDLEELSNAEKRINFILENQ